MAIPERYNTGYNIGVGGAVVRGGRLLLVRRLLAMRLLTVTPVVVLRIGLLLSVTGIAWGPPLIGHRAVPGLLRRWRIPRVIRHVARSLFP